MDFDFAALPFGSFGRICATAAILGVQPSFEKMLTGLGGEIPAFTR